MKPKEAITLAESLLELETPHPKFQYLFKFTRDNLMYLASSTNEESVKITKLIESLNGKLLSDVYVTTMKVFSQFTQYLNSSKASVEFLYDSIKLKNVITAFRQIEDFNSLYDEVSLYTKEELDKKREEVLVEQLNTVLHKIKDGDENNLWRDYNNLMDYMLSCSSFGLLYPQYKPNVYKIVEYMETKRLHIVNECKALYNIYCFSNANSVQDKIKFREAITSLRIIFFKNPDSYISSFKKVEDNLKQLKQNGQLTDREFVYFNTQLIADYNLHGVRDPRKYKPMNFLSRFIVHPNKEDFIFHLAVPFSVLKKVKAFTELFVDNLQNTSVLAVYLDDALKGSAKLREMSIELYLGYLEDTRESLYALYEMKYLTKEAYNYWCQKFIPSSDALDEYDEYMKNEGLNRNNVVNKSTAF